MTKVGRFFFMHGVSDKGGYTSACMCGVVVFVDGFIVFNFSSTPVFVVCIL